MYVFSLGKYWVILYFSVQGISKVEALQAIVGKINYLAVFLNFLFNMNQCSCPEFMFCGETGWYVFEKAFLNQWMWRCGKLATEGIHQGPT